jgi:hypothetical protein
MAFFAMAVALFSDDDYEEVAARLAGTLTSWAAGMIRGACRLRAGSCQGRSGAYGDFVPVGAGDGGLGAVAGGVDPATVGAADGVAVRVPPDGGVVREDGEAETGVRFAGVGEIAGRVGAGWAVLWMTGRPSLPAGIGFGRTSR